MKRLFMKQRSLLTQRGATLASFTVLLPFAVGFLILSLTRIETVLLETRRHAARTQARLLAESALATVVAQIDRGEYNPDRAIGGEIENAGEYRIEVLDADARRYRAVGIVGYDDHLARSSTRTVAEIDFRIAAAESDPKPRLLTEGLTLRIDSN